MADLFRAEWQKLTGHRLVMLFMIWILPIAALIGVVMIVVLVLASPQARTAFHSAEITLQIWARLAPEVWNLPNSVLGRVLMVGFATFAFAGEYQWGTWKNLIPRHRRVILVVNKFMVVAALQVLALVVAFAILILGTAGAIVLSGGNLGAIPGDGLVKVLGASTLQIALAPLLALISAGYAALAAMLTRSILGGVLIGLGATMGEQLLLVVLGQIAGWLHDPGILKLYRFTPTYSMANLTAWVYDGSPASMLQGLVADSAAFSLANLVGWAAGLVALAAFLFHRQDITT